MRIRYFFLSSLLVSTLSVAQSVVQSLPHAFDLSPRVTRGAAPARLSKTISDLGYTDVLIFKNDVRGEVATEIRQLRSHDIAKNRIHHIPFPWKNIRDFPAACKQVIMAAQILVTVQNSSQDRIYFHCTAGEDRTGLLAGIFQLLRRKKVRSSDIKSVFQNEMCGRGYASGNKNKPDHVSESVYESLNPLWQAMSRAIKDGLWSQDDLDPAVCDQLTYLAALAPRKHCPE